MLMSQCCGRFGRAIIVSGRVKLQNKTFMNSAVLRSCCCQGRFNLRAMSYLTRTQGWCQVLWKIGYFAPHQCFYHIPVMSPTYVFKYWTSGTRNTRQNTGQNTRRVANMTGGTKVATAVHRKSAEWAKGVFFRRCHIAETAWQLCPGTRRKHMLGSLSDCSNDFTETCCSLQNASLMCANGWAVVCNTEEACWRTGICASPILPSLITWFRVLQAFLAWLTASSPSLPTQACVLHVSQKMTFFNRSSRHVDGGFQPRALSLTWSAKFVPVMQRPQQHFISSIISGYSKSKLISNRQVFVLPRTLLIRGKLFTKDLYRVSI